MAIRTSLIITRLDINHTILIKLVHGINFWSESSIAEFTHEAINNVTWRDVAGILRSGISLVVRAGSQQPSAYTFLPRAVSLVNSHERDCTGGKIPPIHFPPRRAGKIYTTIESFLFPARATISTVRALFAKYFSKRCTECIVDDGEFSRVNSVFHFVIG